MNYLYWKKASITHGTFKYCLNDFEHFQWITPVPTNYRLISPVQTSLNLWPNVQYRARKKRNLQQQNRRNQIGPTYVPTSSWLALPVGFTLLWPPSEWTIDSSIRPLSSLFVCLALNASSSVIRFGSSRLLTRDPLLLRTSPVVSPSWQLGIEQKRRPCCYVLL